MEKQYKHEPKKHRIVTRRVINGASKTRVTFKPEIRLLAHEEGCSCFDCRTDYVFRAWQAIHRANGNTTRTARCFARTARR